MHEEMLVDGLIGHLQAPLRHDAYPTYDAMLRTMDRYATLGALRAFDEGQAQSFRASTTHALLRGAATFFQKFVLRGGFLDGAHGFLGSAAAAGYAFLKYAKLAELGERARAGEDLAAERSRLLRPPAP